MKNALGTSLIWTIAILVSLVNTEPAFVSRKGSRYKGMTKERLVMAKPPDSIPVCDSFIIHYKKCIFQSSKNLNWERSHDSCRKQGGFLPTDEDMPKLPVVKETEIWSALSNVEGRYQWITRNPVWALKVNWEGGEPQPWETRCPIYNLTSDKYLLSDCQKELAFFCIVDKKLEGDLSSTVELHVSSSFPSNLGWIEVPKGDLSNVMLKCSVKLTRKARTNQPTSIFWRKDGIFLGHDNFTIHLLNTDYAVKANLPQKDIDALLQGTYCCETWVPYASQTVRSNCLLVTLSNITTLVVTAIVKQENWKDNIVTYFKSNPWLSNMSVSYFHGRKIEKSDHFELKYHVHVSSQNLRNDKEILKEFSKSFSESITNHVNDTKVTLTTYCLDKVISLSFGNEMSLPFAKAGHTYNTPFKCVTKENQLVFPKCIWNFTDGARISFPEKQTCLRIEQCPKGFKSIGDQVCIKIIRNVNWKEGHTQLFQTGFERTLFENSKYLTTFKQGLTLHQLILDYLSEENISKLWLPLKRKYSLTPIIDHSINYNKIPFSLFPDIKRPEIKWAQGHPLGNKNCLAFNTKQGTLYTDDCHRKLNYAIIVDLLSFENQPLSNKNEVPPKLSLCQVGWHRVAVTSNEQLCVKNFPMEKFFLWSDAEKFCEREGAHLSFPGRGFMDWMFRSLLKDNETSWINVKKETVKYSSADFDFTNWLPNTNFSRKYGIMSNKGWSLVDEDSGTFHTVICQKKVPRGKRLKLSLEIYSWEQEHANLSNRLCVRAEPEHLLKKNSLKCFQNGAEVEMLCQKRYDCHCMLNLSEQGYYECLAWSNFPLELVWSSFFKHINNNLVTYIVTGMDNSKLYDPLYYDSTFFKKERRSRFEPLCMSSLYRPINNEGVSIGQTYFNSSLGKFQYLFHLQCTIANDSFCRSETFLLDKLNNILTEDINAASVCSVEHIRSSLGCNLDVSQAMNGSSHHMSLTWMATKSAGRYLPKELCIGSNGQSVSRLCDGNFISGYYWMKSPQACTKEPSTRTKNLWQIYSDPIGYLDGHYQSNISKLTKDSDTITAADFLYVASSMQAFAREPMVAERLNFYDVVSTMNNMLGTNNSTISLVNEQFNSTSSLLDDFEQLAFLTHTSTKGGIMKASRKRLLVECVDIKKKPLITGFQTGYSNKLLSTREEIDQKRLDSAIILPRTLSQLVNHSYDSLNDSKLLFAVYKTDSLFQDPGSTASGYKLTSQIIQASFQNSLVTNFRNEVVTIVFRPTYEGENVKCVFWDFAKNVGKGGWSGEGCTFVHFKNKLATCECNHLSCFALLMQPTGMIAQLDPYHEYVLGLITIIGCSLSIVGLVLVLTTFALFESFRKSIDNKVLANLSFAILMSMLIFICGIQQTWNQILCRIVAVTLHYFILASFCWMLIVAVHQYFKFVKVYGYYIPRFLWKSSAFAWGAPAIPILVVLLVDSKLYDNGTSSSICWMSLTAFFYTFIPPVALILLFNIVMYILIINGAILSRRKVQSNQDQRQVMISQMSMAICVFFLLGFTWIFGFLSLINETVVFPYLFCIFNTMQGFFIFFFHLYRSRSARKLWVSFMDGSHGDHMKSRSSQFSRSSTNRRTWSRKPTVNQTQHRSEIQKPIFISLSNLS